MPGFSVDASEVFALAARLEAVGPEVLPVVEAGMVEVGTLMEETWRSNATATSGAHGVHYPGTIKAEPMGLAVEISPKSGMQHAMSFEEGSRNQPPHLDGQKAADVVGPAGAKIIDALVAAVLP